MRIPPLDSAHQVLPVNGSREALFAFAQCVVDPARRRRPWSCAPTPSTRSTRAPPTWRGRAGLPQPVARERFRHGFRGHTRIDLAARATGLRLFAGQSDRQHHDAGRMATTVRARRPPRLRHRRRRVLLGDLFRRTPAAAGRLAGGPPPGPRRLPAAGRVLQPVEALQRAGPALRLRRRRRGDAEAVLALPHLPRLRHEPAGAGGFGRGLERRRPRARQPQALQGEVRPGDAAHCRSPGHPAPRRRLLSLGFRGPLCGNVRYRLRPRTAPPV